MALLLNSGTKTLSFIGTGIELENIYTRLEITFDKNGEDMTCVCHFFQNKANYEAGKSRLTPGLFWQVTQIENEEEVTVDTYGIIVPKRKVSVSKDVEWNPTEQQSLAVAHTKLKEAMEASLGIEVTITDLE